jgi:hypothetical protein
MGIDTLELFKKEIRFIVLFFSAFVLERFYFLLVLSVFLCVYVCIVFNRVTQIFQFQL